MASNFIVEYWYVWAAGLALFPVLAVVPVLKYLRDLLGRPAEERKRVVTRLLNPGVVAVVLLGASASFAAFVLFMAAVILGIVTYIKELFT